MARVRVCSLLPSATEIIAQLGLVDALVGVSAECRWPAEVIGKPVVTRTRIDLDDLCDAEIDSIVRDAVRDGLPLYAVDAGLLDELRPDVIVTQNLCAVCAVSGDDLAAACAVDARIVSLDPCTLADVAESVLNLAHLLESTERGAAIVATFWETIDAAARAVRGLPRRRVFFAEWIDPPFAAGHWLPEMIELAGGRDVLGVAAQPSRPTTWAAVTAAAPQLVVLAPCGFDADRAAAAGADLALDCPAVAVDADGYYARPGPRLADGVAQLAHLFHPEHAADPGLPAIPLRALG
jgi:iron complex transport system substrate-binding protein